MESEEIDLHDAILEGFSVLYGEKSAVIDIAFYQDQTESKERTSAQIIFAGVERINEVSDLIHLEQNKFAGNVAYWHPAAGKGTTYIYLVSGVLAITAQSVEVRVNA
ncbi:MAG: hypothetical protein AB2598_19830 [Candidatus Thiodiazotropha sp.]